MKGGSLMNRKPKFKIICHYPENREELETKIGQIHAEAVIRYLETSNLSQKGKKRILTEIINDR